MEYKNRRLTEEVITRLEGFDTVWDGVSTAVYRVESLGLGFWLGLVSGVRAVVPIVVEAFPLHGVVA